MFHADPPPATLLFALVLAASYDQIVGNIPSRLHPVVGIGQLVHWLCRPAWSWRSSLQCLWGAAVVGITVATSAFVCAQTLFWAQACHPIAEVLIAAYWFNAAFALRLLGDAAQRVEGALRNDDLDAARAGLSWLCSRDPAALDHQQLAGATIESVAENASDSVVAPLCFFVLFGLPGALAYRAINTMDAMIGYHGRCEYLGKVAARVDDLANLLPARLCALLLATVAWRRFPVRRGCRIAWRDARRTASPNAGWPMAMMSGLLGVRLDKVEHYTLGEEFPPPQAVDIARARWLLGWTGRYALLLTALALAGRLWLCNIGMNPS